MELLKDFLALNSIAKKKFSPMLLFGLMLIHVLDCCERKNRKREKQPVLTKKSWNFIAR